MLISVKPSIITHTKEMLSYVSDKVQEPLLIKQELATCIAIPYLTKYPWEDTTPFGDRLSISTSSPGFVITHIQEYVLSHNSLMDISPIQNTGTWASFELYMYGQTITITVIMATEPTTIMTNLWENIYYPKTEMLMLDTLFELTRMPYNPQTMCNLYLYLEGMHVLEDVFHTQSAVIEAFIGLAIDAMNGDHYTQTFINACEDEQLAQIVYKKIRDFFEPVSTANPFDLFCSRWDWDTDSSLWINRATRSDF